jgi:hypothetical protein
MIVFRTFLTLVMVTVGTYTGIVIANHGVNVFPVFLGDMAEFTWPFLSAYLLVQSFGTEGDVGALLLGEHRATR